MKKILLPLSFLLLFNVLQGQVAPNKYYVQFTDKNNSPYSINNPSQYLSQRAIDRRNAQGIPIDIYDLPVNPSYLQGVAATGAIILNPTKWLNGVTVYTESQSVVDAIGALPYVAWVSIYNKASQAEPSSKPFFSHELYNQPAGLSTKEGAQVGAYDYGFALNQIQQLNGTGLHDMGYRGQGMVIAVLDAGFLNANNLDVFDSLWANNQILGTWDFVEDQPISFDEHPHGSMVLSTMGANLPGQMIGTAPKASYWLLRSEDGGSEYIIEEYNWVSAAEFADSVGADLINSSLGYTTFDNPAQDHTYADMDGNTTPSSRGADFAASRGILVVNSLGNEGSSSWYYLSAPSDGDSIMGIGAVDGSGFYASFSSHGPSYDGRVKPDVCAQGSGSCIADPYANMISFGSGTSFSSPIMCGMTACLWQANPEKNNIEVIDAIRHSASQYLNPDATLGYGIPNFMNANDFLTVIDNPASQPVQMSVYPNPFTNEIRVTIVNKAGQGSGQVVISDLAGRQLLSQGITFEKNAAACVVSGLDRLDAGVYLVTLRTDEGSVNTKIVKE